MQTTQILNKNSLYIVMTTTHGYQTISLGRHEQKTAKHASAVVFLEREYI